MVFSYQNWDRFCKKLYDAGLRSIPACEVAREKEPYLVLKHDVETAVPRALALARIERKYGHRGSFYVQAYLLGEEENVALLRQIREMGHEVSYHYDVLDGNKGDFEKALAEFAENIRLFEEKGFPVVTVCQHANPVANRVGYTSNRDFFRSDRVQSLYPHIADILVDFKRKYHTDYTYYSDAGRRFTAIYDPIDNDRIKSDDKNIPYDDLDAVFAAVRSGGSAMLSTHSHRWCASAAEYAVKNALFMTAKGTAKLLLRVPGMKKLMGRYYFLAKKL